MDQTSEPLIVKAANQEQDLPPGTPAYSMGAFLASGRTSVVPPVPSPTVTPTQPTASVTPGFTSLGDRARDLVNRATTGISNLLGPTYNAVKSAAAAVEDPFRFRTPTEKATGKDFLTGAPILANRTSNLESGLNDLERKSTVPKVPNFYEQRLAQETSR